MAKIIAGCKHCGHLFKIEELFEGIDVECPKCGKMVVVSRVADRDEHGLPVFSEDMDQILDQIYKKAEEMEQFESMEQIEEMAETLEVDQGLLQQAAAARAAKQPGVKPASRKVGAKKPLTQYKIVRPKRSLKKLIVLCVILAIVGAGGYFGWSFYSKQKEFRKNARDTYGSALGCFDVGDFEGCLSKLKGFFPKYEKTEVARKAKDLKALATTEYGAQKLMAEAKQHYEKKELLQAIEKINKLVEDFKDSTLHTEATQLRETWSAQKTLKNAQAEFESAQALFSEGKLQEALSKFKRIAGGNWAFSQNAKEMADQIEIYEKDAHDLYDTGQQALLDNFHDTAITNFQEVLKDYPYSQAARLAEEAINNAADQKQRYMEDNYDRHMAAARQYEAVKKYRNAWEEYREARSKWKPEDQIAQEGEDRTKKLADLYEDMILIDEVPFVMGSDGSDPDEKPAHTVNLDAYYISKYPVTNEEYKRFLDDPKNKDHPAPYSDAKWAQAYNWNKRTRMYPRGKGRHPVVLVSYSDAEAYCKWAGKRLPTEAEWEKAARGTDQRMYPWGNAEPNTKLCNFKNANESTTAVDTYHAGASPHEAMDMAGNVWEWCADYYKEDFYEDPAHKNNARNPMCMQDTGKRVLRGGSWANTSGILRCSNRYAKEPDKMHVTIGFRTAFTP